MANYDNDVLGTGNINHPANERDLTDREMLTEVYNVSKDVLEIFDAMQDDLDFYRLESLKNKKFLNDMVEVLSNSKNGYCIIIKNHIQNFLNK